MNPRREEIAAEVVDKDVGFGPAGNSGGVDFMSFSGEEVVDKEVGSESAGNSGGADSVTDSRSFAGESSSSAAVTLTTGVVGNCCSAASAIAKRPRMTWEGRSWAYPYRYGRCQPKEHTVTVVIFRLPITSQYTGHRRQPSGSSGICEHGNY